MKTSSIKVENEISSSEEISENYQGNSDRKFDEEDQIGSITARENTPFKRNLTIKQIQERIELRKKTILNIKKESRLSENKILNSISMKYNMHALNLSNKLQRLFVGIIRNNLFQSIIFCSILFNIIILMADSSSLTKQKIIKLEKINFSLTLIFFAEILAKIFALGFRNFFINVFDKLDFIILFSNIAEIFYEIIVGINIFYPKTPFSPIVQALKLLRIIRYFIDFKIWENAALMLFGIARTLKKISYFILIILLFILATTIIGIEIFAFKIRFDDNNKVPKKLYEFFFIY